MKFIFLMLIAFPGRAFPGGVYIPPPPPAPIVRTSAPNDDYVFCRSENDGKDNPNHSCFIGFNVDFFGNKSWSKRLTFREYLVEVVGSDVEFLGATPVDGGTTVIFFRRGK